MLRPPGGGSSNIFGTDPEPAAPVRRAPQQTLAAYAPAPAPVAAPVRQTAPQNSAPWEQQQAAPVSGRRRPPGGESSIVFG